jgi:hypothetical protein
VRAEEIELLEGRVADGPGEADRQRRRVRRPDHGAERSADVGEVARRQAAFGREALLLDAGRQRLGADRVEGPGSGARAVGPFELRRGGSGAG